MPARQSGAAADGNGRRTAPDLRVELGVALPFDYSSATDQNLGSAYELERTLTIGASHRRGIGEGHEHGTGETLGQKLQIPKSKLQTDEGNNRASKNEVALQTGRVPLQSRKEFKLFPS